MSGANRILITRTDRLGDVLLSLPTVLLLRKALVKRELSFCVPQALIPTLTPLLKSDHIEVIESESEMDFSRYGAALFLHSPQSWLWQAFVARVRYRVGIYSKPASFFLLSHGLRQRRSKAKQNEGQYNVDLAKEMLVAMDVRVPSEIPKVLLPIQTEPQQKVSRQLSQWGLGERVFAIVHPGMGGSALNLSAAGYQRLITAIETDLGMPVVLSFGPGRFDQTLKKEFASRKHPVIEGSTLPELVEWFRAAGLVVAPSTGPLHLAHLAGTPTYGVYSPVRSHHPTRWAPWGGKAPSAVGVPELGCPGKSDCKKQQCPQFSCLESWDWAASLVSQARKLQILTN